MKIVINTCYGGFSLSEEALFRYAELKGLTLYPETSGMFTVYWTIPPEQRLEKPIGNWMSIPIVDRAAYNEFYKNATLNFSDLDRDDLVLVQIIEELSTSANGKFANLKIVEIPDDVDWEIKEYDGVEWIAEKHRTWS